METRHTLKVTTATLRAIQRIAKRTGEKQYRVVERLAKAEEDARKAK